MAVTSSSMLLLRWNSLYLSRYTNKETGCWIC